MPENLEQRGGIWHLRYVHKGKVYRKSTGVHDLARAKRRATAIKKEIQDGTFGWVKTVAPTFKDWATQYLNKYYALGTGAQAFDAKRPYTERGYIEGNIFKRVAAVVGSKRIDAITQSDLVGYVRMREGEGAAVATVNRELVALRLLYRAAIADKLVTDNPCDGIKRKKPNVRKRLLTRENEAVIRKHADPTWVRYMDVALGTGLRAKELRMMRPCDLRHDGTWVFVQAGSNKRNTSREVPLSPAVMTALKEQAQSREGGDTTPYWPEVGGTHAYRYFERLCARLKIEQVSPHDFRRTFATRWVERGGNLKNLQTVLGHKDIAVTMEIYLSFNSGSVRDTLMEVMK